MEDISYYKTRPNTCTWAREFESWTRDLVKSVQASPSTERINQAKLGLLDRYYEWRARTPVQHKRPDGKRGKHRCISEVMDETYNKLQAEALKLNPPLLSKPPKPKKPLPPPPPPDPPPLRYRSKQRKGGEEK